jgi:hypothetical protein
MAHGKNAEQCRNKEYWSNRPGIKMWSISYKPGSNKWAKRFTHKLERIMGKKDIKEQLEEGKKT